MKALLKINELSGGYTKKNVLNNISLEVNKGELVGLIGLNGAGKSTMIKHIIGLMHQKSGQITLLGKTLNDDEAFYRKSFTYVPEMPLLYDELTLREHLKLTAMAYHVDEKKFNEIIPPLLKLFRLNKELDHFPVHFSKGMKQKVMILCAFLVQPDLYVVDEPFVGLDPQAIQAFLDLMVAEKKRGAGILMSTHILATAERYCDRFIILHKGEIKAQGTLEELQVQMQAKGERLDDIYLRLTKEEDGLDG